jgi:hypothetical protein
MTEQREKVNEDRSHGVFVLGVAPEEGPRQGCGMSFCNKNPMCRWMMQVRVYIQQPFHLIIMALV